MGRNAIEASGLGKRYLLGQDRAVPSLRDLVAGSLARVRHRGRRPDREEVWSLRDVDLEVQEGQSLGVIGRNGAGKSTLLKILSRITEPTTGWARTRGRVGALLEVGTGFHVELTGRENVYLNGAILGMGRREIERRFDEIVDFAGVERFIDTPIKRYSTGMHLRLAFAVAAHLEPDILIVDEVLAVGDVEFQAKCLGRMSLAGSEGRTIVFVSHNLDAITRLCPETIWLDAGRVAAAGSSVDVVDAYLDAQVDRAAAAGLARDEMHRVSLDRVDVVDATGRSVEIARRDRPLSVTIDFTVLQSLGDVDVSVQVNNMWGVEVLNESWSDVEASRPSEPGRYRATVELPPVLNVGDYVIGVWLGNAMDTFLHEQTAGHVRIEGDVRGRPRRAVELGLPWRVERVSSGDE